MSATSCLKRIEDDTVPSWPLESMSTGMALALPVVTPRMPAMNVRVWLPIADADRAALAGHALVADVDVVAAGGEVVAGVGADRVL